jgi:hypothetical protein
MNLVENNGRRRKDIFINLNETHKLEVDCSEFYEASFELNTEQKHTEIESIGLG